MPHFDYFKHCEDKYNLRLHQTKPIVVRFDGIGVTKNKKLDLLDESTGSLTWALRESAKILSRKYEGIALVGSDEISFILTPRAVKRCLGIEPNGDLKLHKLLSYLGQELTMTFNYLYEGDALFFDGRGFSLNPDKIEAYLRYRHYSTRNTMIHYIGKQCLSAERRRGLSLPDLEIAIRQQDPIFDSFPRELLEGIEYEKGMERSPNPCRTPVIVVDDSQHLDSF